MPHIVVADDDQPILDLISEYLRKEGWTVTPFSDGSGLIDFVRRKDPDLLILDIMMPGINGLSLLTELRTFSEVPIIMISAKGEEADRIIGLELGCNDFLPKPFNPRELVGRIKAILRLVSSLSSQGDAGEAVCGGNVTIYPNYRRVIVNETDLSLTSREYELLLFLLSRIGRPFSREQLIQQVWRYDFVGDVRVVDDLVKRLRRKLADAGATATIETVWGFGYKAVEKL